MCRAHSDLGVRGAEARDAPTAAKVSSGAAIGRARLNPSGSTPGRLFGEQGSILCSRSRIRGTGILQVSRHETLEKPETESIIARTTERMEGFRGGFGSSRPTSLAAMWQRSQHRSQALLPPQPQGADPPHPAQQLPLSQRHPRVVERRPSPVGLTLAPEAPECLGLRGQRQPVIVQHRQLQSQQPLLRRQPRQALPWRGCPARRLRHSSTSGHAAP